MHFYAFNTQSKDIQKDIHAGNLNKDNLHIKIYFVDIDLAVKISHLVLQVIGNLIHTHTLKSFKNAKNEN